MKRIYSLNRNRRFSTAATVTVALGVFIAFVFIVRFFFPVTFLAVSSPVLGLSNSASVGIAGFSNGFANGKALAEERDALTLQNETLAAQNDVLSAKILDLERLLGTEPPPVPGVVAGVLARPPESPYDTLIVAAGSNAGIAVGDVVLAAGGIRIGAVTSVAATAAQVTLLSSPGTATDAWLGAARAPITLTGAGGGSFSASVPRAASITVGDIVYIGGPGALPVAIVRGENGDPSSPTATLDIATSVNFFSLPYVLIEPAARVP